MKKKPLASRGTTVILNGVCAVIWTVLAVERILEGDYRRSMFWFVLSIACAVLWIVSFVASWLAYRAAQKEEEGNSQ